MSRELNYSGNIVGSTSYFKKINEEAKLNDIVSNVSFNTYHELIKNLALNSTRVIESVYATISVHPRLLPFIKSDNLRQMFGFVENLEELAKFGGKSVSKASECKSLLRLSDSKTRSKSGASISAIEDGVKYLRNNQTYELQKLIQRYGKEFADDIMLVYEFQKLCS